MSARLYRVHSGPQGRPPTAAELEKATPALAGACAGMLAENPGLVALYDQWDAAQIELSARLRRLDGATVITPLGENITLTTRDVQGRHAQLVGLRLQVAAVRLVQWRCEHVLWPPGVESTAKITASLAARVALCGAPKCLKEAMRRWGDDGCCEMCERPSERFTTHTVPIGNVNIVAELCPECSSWIGS